MKTAKLVLLLLLAAMTGNAQLHSKMTLRQQINALITASGGKVGVGVLGLGFKDSLVINNGHQYPMQSVFKFPLALLVLHRVDEGKLSLSQIITVKKEMLDTNTWSPMVKDFLHQDIRMSVADLLKYTVSKSDNNGCDMLFGLVGGPLAVNDYIHGLGVREINIAATEAGMRKAWAVQYTNWCRPSAMLQLLQILHTQKALSVTSNAFLLKLMTESENSPKRIKGLLPASAVVAHKTGTSDTNKKGITAAANDVGIITLPDGRHLAMVVYVSDFKGGNAKGEKLIAEISKLVWDFYTAKR